MESYERRVAEELYLDYEYESSGICLTLNQLSVACVACVAHGLVKEADYHVTNHDR